MMSTAARRATLALIALHGILLLLTLPDYFVSIDSGYHVSLARWYGEHGTAWWDHINFGPGGRPNLQGPFLHMSVGYLGRAMGGGGMDYVRANAILALAEWGAAIFSAWFFARRHGGDWAALFAVALLSGALFSSISFAVGVPSGWAFIFSAWAVWFFVEDRLALSVLFTCLAIYSHLGGFAMAPLAVFVAAALQRRWKALAIVGGATAILTSPYSIHFLGNLAWYRGRRGDEALMLAPLTYIPAAFGVVRILRHPRKNVFLAAWLAASAPWIAQDYKRFLLQSPLVLAVIAGGELARFREWMAPRFRAAFATGLIALATLFPFTLPALAFEVKWNLGPRFPRILDWNERKQLAEVIGREGLNHRLVNVWNPTQCIAMAVFVPMTFQYGHWVEVQPRVYPAHDLSAGVKVYALPTPPDDPVLRDMAAHALLTIHGGTWMNSIVTLDAPAPLDEAARNLARVGSEQAAWLAEHAQNNRMPTLGELISDEAVARFRARAKEQRTRTGRIKAAILVYAYALEKNHPREAYGARGAADGFGEMANLLGDEATLDFRSEAKHRQLKANLAVWARAIRCFEKQDLPTKEMDRANGKVFEDYF
ncbi:MAG: hypothetical protein LAQ30_23295 [Acidobacteriia bacterium]|nr:hypothetical protein [Terriglobia bacterium]